MTRPLPNAEELLSESAWVRELAGRLVRDPDQADDVAQETLLHAVRQASGVRSPRAWLATAMRNVLRNRSRDDSRRQDRERAVMRSDHAPAAADIVARASTQHLVVESVLMLREPYRRVVLMRFFDDLPTRRIARELQVPVSTVETRLQRGLAMLRRELDRRFGGDRERWMHALLPLVPAASGSSVAVVAMVAVILGASVAATHLVSEARRPPIHRVVDAGPRVEAPTPPEAPPPPAPVPDPAPSPPADEDVADSNDAPPTEPDPPPEPDLRTWSEMRARTDGDWPGMVRIPAGTAVIGLTPEDIKSTVANESLIDLRTLAMAVPRHSVPIAAFQLDRTEVTNAQWRVYLDDIGAEPGEDLVANYWIDGRIPIDHEDHPVVYVSQGEAGAFASWCGKRLPTELEWEYAARGEQGRIYPWGYEYEDGMARNRTVTPTGPGPVGSFPDGASPFGVLDMAGSVWEWTSSRAVAYPDYREFLFDGKYLKRARISGAEFFDGGKVILRGGAFDSKGIALLAAVRQTAERETWFNTVGFRCARSERPGVDVIRDAVTTLGAFRLRGSPLRMDEVHAIEPAPSEHQPPCAWRGLAVAAVDRWPDKNDRTADLDHARDRARSFAIPVAVVVTSVDLLRPPVPAGKYLVGWRHEDGNDHFAWIPESGRIVAEQRIDPVNDVAHPASETTFRHEYADDLVRERVRLRFDVDLGAGRSVAFTLPVEFDAGAFAPQ